MRSFKGMVKKFVEHGIDTGETNWSVLEEEGTLWE